MKRTLLFFFSILPLCTYAQLTYLNRAIPEDVGLRSADVLQYLDTIMSQSDNDVHGVMLLRDGQVVAEKYNEPFEARYSHTLYSCSKTFTGVAVGLAIQDSLLQLTDRLVDLLPEHLPLVVGDTLAAITVRDLLTMQSGWQADTRMRTVEKEWIRFYLNMKPTAMPGQRFVYDSICSYLLSAIVQKVEGQSIMELLKRRIFLPLGITQVAWEESPEGISCGGWGLYMQLESMAKFGQLLLNRGEWKGEQLISAAWVDEMMQHHSTTSTNQRYGYHIWLTDFPGMTQCDGAYGQYIMLLPDRHMAVALTQCMRGTAKKEQRLFYQLSQKVSDKPLPHDDASYRLLSHARYRLRPAKGKSFSDLMLSTVRLFLDRNDLGWRSVDLDFAAMRRSSTLTLQVTNQQGETYPIVCGSQKWVTSQIKGYPLNFRPFQGNFSNISGPFFVGASYSWTSDSDLYIRLHYTNWLSSCLLHFSFLPSGSVKTDITLGYVTKRLMIGTKMQKL
ncbi:MAG: serine hydrolase [Bacteroidales bacterium]|nr:serine hydrolase [Candidatus Physcousia equi]